LLLVPPQTTTKNQTFRRTSLDMAIAQLGESPGDQR